MIRNIEPPMNDARRNDEHVADLQLDFACANRHAASAARTVRSAVGVVRAAPAVDNFSVNERRAGTGDNVIALGLIVVRDGALKCVRWRIGHLFSTRRRWGRSLGIATTSGSLGIASTAGSLSSGLTDRHHFLLPAMNDAQLHA